MRRTLLLAITMTVATAVGLHTNLAGIEAAPRYKVSVWYPGWGTSGTSDYQSVSENAATVDEVNPFWYKLKADGFVASYEWAEDPKLLSLAREKGITVMPLISNEFDPERVHRVISTEAARAAHAKRLTDLVVSKGYDGLDLDYESLRAEDRDEFSLFVETLASRLHARDKKLAIAVHAKTSEPGGWSGARAQDWKRLGRAADEFKIMLYDYHWNGSEAGPAAPPGWIDEVLTFAETRVAPYKIRMGLPFYGRDWRGTEATDLVYAEVRQLAEERSATMHRHPSGEPYFEYSGDHTVYYQDSRSIGMKLEVLKRKHPKVGGIAVWHVGGESQNYWTTLKNKLGR